MAHHKKKRPPAARAHCSMCKPWKDGRIARDSEEFEKFSDHKRRINIERDIEEDRW